MKKRLVMVGACDMLAETDIALSELREIVNLTKEGDWTISKRKQILENIKKNA
ncbi:hypothetical protein PO124_13140 [Bacillus licheniformis]|nr:hypothetical protein [Bacillus licheniformis]